MIKIMFSRIIIVIATGIWLVTGCADIELYKNDNKRQEVENKTPAFNPAYFKDVDRRHLAIVFDVVDGKLRPDPQPAQQRPGSMPYRTATAGNVLIIYKDALGKELGRYAVEDPVLARSCDFEEGQRIGETKPLKHAKVEILLPDDSAIHSVVIGRIDGKSKSFDISAQVEKRQATGHLKK